LVETETTKAVRYMYYNDRLRPSVYGPGRIFPPVFPVSESYFCIYWEPLNEGLACPKADSNTEEMKTETGIFTIPVFEW